MPRKTIPCPVCKGESTRIFLSVQKFECSKCGLKFTPNPELSKKPGHPEIVTLSGAPRCEGYDGPAPCPIDEKTGMHQDYWVLSEEERAKGYVKPVRRSYKHVGQRPKYSLRVLTPEEKERYKGSNYTYYEMYPESESPLVGRFWTAADLNSGCGATTTMATALAETYARDPHFYGATFCANCRTHFALAEFVWIGTAGKIEENMDPNLEKASA